MRCYLGPTLEVIGALIFFTVVGLDLVALGMHSDNFGSICAPFPGLIFSLYIDIELVQEGLDVYLILDD